MVSLDRLFSLAFRSVLVLAGIWSVLNDRWMEMCLICLTLFITFLPTLFSRRWKHYDPSGFDMLILLFMLASLLFSRFSEDVWWLSDMTNGIVIGLIGFSLVIILNLEKSSIMRLSPNFVALFAFSFSVAVGALWELTEASFLFLFNIQLDPVSLVTVRDLGVDVVGALIVSFFGYMALRVRDKGLMIRLISGFSDNPLLFPDYMSRPDYVKGIIRDGETEQVEFKSTLRTNIHTRQPDKNIVMSALKTVVAYLNSDGGTLLIGVGDDGSVTGVEVGEFDNKDRLYLYFTGLLKKHIGNEFRAFIRPVKYR